MLETFWCIPTSYDTLSCFSLRHHIVSVGRFRLIPRRWFSGRKSNFFLVKVIYQMKKLLRNQSKELYRYTYLRYELICNSCRYQVLGDQWYYFYLLLSIYIEFKRKHFDRAKATVLHSTFQCIPASRSINSTYPQSSARNVSK